MPSVQVALELYQVLSQSDTNLRQPVRLENQLLQDQRMDSDIGKSMLQLLQVPTSCCILPAPLLDSLFHMVTLKTIRQLQRTLPGACEP